MGRQVNFTLLAKVEIVTNTKSLSSIEEEMTEMFSAWKESGEIKKANFIISFGK